MCHLTSLLVELCHIHLSVVVREREQVSETPAPLLAKDRPELDEADYVLDSPAYCIEHPVECPLLRSERAARHLRAVGGTW